MEGFHLRNHLVWNHGYPGVVPGVPAVPQLGGPAPVLPPLPWHLVLLGQLAVCAALLLLVQPVFVMTPATSKDAVPVVCPTRVLAASVATTAGTWLLHTCGATPQDTFRGACEVLTRVAR